MSEKSNFTSYDTKVPQNHPEYKSEILEETKKGGIDRKQLKKAGIEVTDLDQDGRFEIKKTDLTQVLKIQGKRIPHLASYFADPKTNNSKSRLEHLPPKLKIAASSHNFQLARAYFTDLAKGKKNPLEVVAEPLARHLAASAVHPGINLDDSVALETSNGFSTTREGRLRLDCGGFAQLAYSDLKGIPSITLQYISMYKGEGDKSSSAGGSAMSMISSHVSSQSVSSYPRQTFSFNSSRPINSDSSGHHYVLLVTGQNGSSLIVDNDQVQYFEQGDSHQILKDVYQPQGYSLFFTRQDVTNPNETPFN